MMPDTAYHEKMVLDKRTTAQAAAVSCPYCPMLVHPLNWDAHMAHYHDIAEPLTYDETCDLASHEATIQAGIETFYAVGQALARIRDRRLYRAHHRTFAAYCAERWQMTRTRGYQLIQAAGVVDVLSTGVDTGNLPEYEVHIRPLVALPDEALIPVWTVIRETAPGGKITGAHVKSVTNVAKEMIKTGAIDDGTGKSVRVADVFNVNVIEETYERAARQKAYIVANSKRERILATEATVHSIANEDDAVTLKIRLPKGTDMSAVRDAWFNHKPLFITAYVPKEETE